MLSDSEILKMLMSDAGFHSSGCNERSLVPVFIVMFPKMLDHVWILNNVLKSNLVSIQTENIKPGTSDYQFQHAIPCDIPYSMVKVDNRPVSLHNFVIHKIYAYIHMFYQCSLQKGITMLLKACEKLTSSDYAVNQGKLQPQKK